MNRPCFLVVDREYPGNISTRKLVIETAKFNVLTAYDAHEAVTCLKRFPNVDGVVINATIADDDNCRLLIEDLRRVVRDIEIVITSAGGYRHCYQNEHHIDSLDPRKLLSCLQDLHEEATRRILARENEMSEPA